MCAGNSVLGDLGNVLSIQTSSGSATYVANNTALCFVMDSIWGSRATSYMEYGLAQVCAV